MNEDKTMEITECITALGELIDDYETVQTFEVEEQAEKLIIAKARELVALADGEEKSEMPCNCADAENAPFVGALQIPVTEEMLDIITKALIKKKIKEKISGSGENG